MTRKELSFLLWMALIIILVFASGCGPSYHLKRAKHHWNKAIEKGAKTTVDTVWQTIPVISPAITFTTTIRPDWVNMEVKKTTFTAEDEKTGAKTDVDVGLREGCPPDCIEYVEIHTHVPEQKKEEKVPASIHMEARAGHSNWGMIVLALFCLGVGAIIGRLFWK